MIRQALQQLVTANLLKFSETEIRFCQTNRLTGESAALARQMFEGIHENNRDQIIAVPRCMLKLICQAAKKVVRVATLIGLLLTTMLVKKYGECNGCCKAEWIANLFGVDAKRVGHDRAKLIAEGWFKIISTSQWVLDRYGQWVALNLEPTTPGANTTDHSKKTQPQNPAGEQQLQPPLKPSSPPTEDFKNQQLDSGVSKHSSCQEPNWNHIILLDLEHDARSEKLHQQAIKRQVLRDTEADRINFFAAIAHALRVAKSNPCGLLRTVVEKQLWHVISQADEHNGIRRLRQFREAEYSVAISKPVYPFPMDSSTPPETPPAGPEVELSKDAFTVEHLTATLKRSGCVDDLFQLIQRQGFLQDWSRERWNQASAELDQ